MKNYELNIKCDALLPKAFSILFIVFITWYTYVTFFFKPMGVITIGDIALYFLPSILMLSLLVVGWKHRRFEGISLIILSFAFLWMFQVYISLASFVFLLFTGTLFLTNSNKGAY